MTTGDLSLQKPLSTNDTQENYKAQQPQKHWTNGHSKKNGKMEAVYEEIETMEETMHDSTSTGPMQSSTRLTAKLKKLMETKMTPEFCPEAMENDAEEQKKWARAITLAGAFMDREKKDHKMAAPEIKKLWNDETLP